MSRVNLVLLLLAVVIRQGAAQQVRHAEMLGRPTDTSINVTFMLDAASEARISYGTDSIALSMSTPWTSVQANAMHDVVITDLEPNTQYYYRLQLRSENTARPLYRFHTQRSRGTPFTFVIQADPHMDEQSDTGMYQRALLNQLEDRPDFMFDLGDIIMSDKLKGPNGKVGRDTITIRNRFMRSLYESTCHSVPLFIALGNHEGESGWALNATAENVPTWSAIDRTTYFRNPTPDAFYTGDTTTYPNVGKRGSYYAFEWGDALFITLDPYWYTRPKPDSLTGWRWTLGREQYEWLRTTLKNSTATYKFVFAHQLVGGDPDGRGGIEYADRYEWGGKNLDGTDGFAANRPGWYKPLKDIFREHRVSVFFHGHDHFYAQQIKDCLIYQETPQPSHPSISNANSADDYGYLSGTILPNSGHLRVNVSPDGVKVEYVRTYVPRQETGSRKNKDVSATYFIGKVNCYDSLVASVPILYNAAYIDEHVAPNPFHETTRIAFTVKSGGRHTVLIRDISGRVVRQLLDNADIDAGSYQLVWDGLGQDGRPVPSGAYVYEIIEPSTGSQTGMMVREGR